MQIDKPSDVTDETWADFLILRKAKKAPVTNTALKGIRREASLAGLLLEEALVMCCERGWRGFRAEWVRSTSKVAQWSQFVAEEQHGRLLASH